MLALKTNAKVSIQHISSGNSVDLVRFAKSLGAKGNSRSYTTSFFYNRRGCFKA